MPFAARHRPSDARLLRRAPQVLFLALPVLAAFGVVFLTQVDHGAAPPSPAPAVQVDDRQLLAQAQAQWRGLDALLAPCDAAAGGGGQDRALSRTASRLCRKAALDLLAFKPPAAAVPHLQARFQIALETCQYDYVRRGNAYDQLAKAQDREAIDTARAEVDRADLESHGCRIGYIVAARAAGLPFDAFPPPVAGY
jgi:hypothetical protein